MRLTDPRVTSSLALSATAVWLGGLLALGAIVAPIIFTAFPRLEAADAMTLVFQRFDAVALGCVVVVLGTEAARAIGRAPGASRIRKADIARMAAAAVGSVLVLTEAVWITPAIVRLHRSGAIRGLGADGQLLDRMHGLAETCGKGQVVLAIVLIVLHVVTLRP
jgi:hypothetical protein